MRDLVRYGRYYLAVLRHRLFLAGALIVTAALVEALGLTLLLPLIQEGSGTDPLSRGVARGFELIGIAPSFTPVLILMLVLLLLRTVLVSAKEIYVAHLTTSMVVNLRDQFMTRLGKADYAFVASKDHGFLTNAMTLELTRIPFAFEQFAVIVTGLLFAAGYFLMALILSPWLASSSIVLVPLAIAILPRINRRTRELALKSSDAAAGLQGWMIQCLHSFKYLKATARFERVASRIRAKNRELGHLYFRSSLLQIVAGSLLTPITLVFVAIVLIIRVTWQGAPVIEAAFTLFVLKRAMDQALGVQQSFRKLLASEAGMRIHENLMQELETHREPDRGQGFRPDFSSPIVFRNVSFRYVADEYVLRDVSLTIEPRSVVAIVGASGAGKSTIVTLLTGLLRPTDGEITIGGVAYEKIDQVRLREGIGFVTQESVIFSDTLRNNVTLWDDGGSDQRLTEALRQAHVTEFIPRLSDGRDTLLGNDGANISGGQRQRVTIARELYKNAQLLIFDEATSAVDTATEREIQRGIEELRGGKTLVLIAHRLSTVANADTIFVLKDGRLVESGSFDELRARNGEFARMVAMQGRSEETPAVQPASAQGRVDAGV